MPNCLSTYLVLTYFQTYFAYFDLLEACWQPSCSTVDYSFNAACLKPELLSRDGVIRTIVLLMTQMLYYYTWTKKQRQKNEQLYVW